MPYIETTYLALLDIARLRAFLAVKNPEAAERASTALRNGIKQIAHSPEGFVPVPDMPYHREKSIPFGGRGYIVRYRYERGGNITILRVRHQLEDGYPNLITDVNNSDHT